MKKITSISLIIFAIIIGAIFFYSLIFNAPSAIVNPPIINNNGSQPTTNQSGLPILDKTEIAKHSTPSDCYLIINNNVYDVSSYTASHPGGKQIINTNCGAEATSIFTSIHSNRAWDLLARYKVGILAK